MNPEAFLALMRRYSITFAGGHDLSILDELMEPEYVVKTSGLTLYRDPDYKPTVAKIFQLFPGLDFVVHEIITNGDRLAMRFSEHGMTKDRRASSWRGVALYNWNGERLTTCWVEQDFYARRRQLKSGEPDALDAPHLDPWTGTTSESADQKVEDIAADWLKAGDLLAAGAGWIDDAPATSYVAPIDVLDVQINDLFSAGDKAAFHATFLGECLESFEGPDFAGRSAEISVAGLLSVTDGRVAEIQAVTDRLGLRARLVGGALLPTG